MNRLLGKDRLRGMNRLLGMDKLQWWKDCIKDNLQSVDRLKGIDELQEVARLQGIDLRLQGGRGMGPKDYKRCLTILKRWTVFRKLLDIRNKQVERADSEKYIII